MTDDTILCDLSDLIGSIIHGDSIGIDTYGRSRCGVILDEDIDSRKEKGYYRHDIHTLEDTIYDEKKYDNEGSDIPLCTPSMCRCKMPLEHNI
jgi:hypothetical protein